MAGSRNRQLLERIWARADASIRAGDVLGRDHRPGPEDGGGRGALAPAPAPVYVRGEQLTQATYAERRGPIDGSEVSRPCGCLADPAVFGHVRCEDGHMRAGCFEGIWWQPSS